MDQRKDQLIQQYEEAALGLLMEEYANAQGGLLLEKFRTEAEQGDMTMPGELDAKCEKLISRAYGKTRCRRALAGIARTVGKVAVVAVALLGLASVTILSVEAWRVPVLNFFIDKGEGYGFVNVGYYNPALKKQFEQILDKVCGAVPQGYEIISNPRVDEAALLIQMENKEGKLLTVEAVSESSSIKVDTEDAEVVEMDLNGRQGYFVAKDGAYIIWLDEGQHLVYSVYAQDLQPDEFWALVYSLAE